MLILAVGIAAVAMIAVVALFLVRPRSQTAPTRPAAPVVQDQRKREVTILYGTQTGTAQRFSEELRDSLKGLFGEEVECKVVDMEDYEHEKDLASERLVFMMLATYGDGEPTTNASTFYLWLTGLADESSKPDLLQGTKFGIFGLGNRQYEEFCAVGKKVHHAMLSCGAQPVIQNGEGNDDDDIQSDFDLWKRGLLDSLQPTDVIPSKAVK